MSDHAVAYLNFLLRDFLCDVLLLSLGKLILVIVLVDACQVKILIIRFALFKERRPPLFFSIDIEMLTIVL